jgi:cellulose synthase/poly-beta-1,6-N-acetylglucosamine synthase-like glycosyltransferase
MFEEQRDRDYNAPLRGDQHPMNTDLASTRLALTKGYARPDRFSLSVVVPCFNEQEVIAATYQRLVAVLGNGDFDSEIVFVDDGSTDSTPRLAANFTREDPRVKTVLLSRKFRPPSRGQCGSGECGR